MKLTKRNLIQIIKEEVASHIAEEEGQWKQELQPIDIASINKILTAIDTAAELGVPLDKITAAIDGHISKPQLSAYEKHRADHGMDDI